MKPSPRESAPAAAIFAIALATGALTHSALAQTPTPPAAAPAPGFLGGDSKSPVDISSENLEVIQPQRLYIYSGNVEAIQADARLRTPKLWIYDKVKAAPGGKPVAGAAPNTPDMGNLDHIDAEGPVYYVTSTQNARGDHGHYDADTKTITLEGNVVLAQGKSVGKGDKLIINRLTGVSSLIASNPKAAAGRIRTILYPQQQTAPASPPAAKPPGSPS